MVLVWIEVERNNLIGVADVADAVFDSGLEGEVMFLAEIVEGFPGILECIAVENGEWGLAVEETSDLRDLPHGDGEEYGAVGDGADMEAESEAGGASA